MTDRAAPQTEAGKRLAKLLARDYDEDFLSPDWTHPSEMILAIEREAAALVPQQDRATPRTEAAWFERLAALLHETRQHHGPPCELCVTTANGFRRQAEYQRLSPPPVEDRDPLMMKLAGWLADPEPAAAAGDRDRREARLIEALRYQWEMNHSEHCRNEWPHAGRCTWPQPDALLAAPGQAGPPESDDPR